MPEHKNLSLKKVAMVSHDYNLVNSHGHQDFAEHASFIHSVCDGEGCDTILYSLFTWDENSPFSRNHQTIFGDLKNVRCVILEVGNKQSTNKVVEVWLKEEETPHLMHQYFAKSSDPYERKREFIRSIAKRIIGNGLVAICGESNIANYMPSNGNYRDDFGFNGELKQRGIRFVLNPLHDYMRRYEMKKKRAYYSSDQRMVITVWNMGKGKESSIPWTVFYNGTDITAQVREVSPHINRRPDIRIGIVPEIPVMTASRVRNTIIMSLGMLKYTKKGNEKCTTLGYDIW
jgi:hypothetical protein